jgi:SAM-dependent methyltransferase
MATRASPWVQATQDSYFTAADAARFRWTTEDPAFAPAETALLVPRIADLPAPCLEIGCGEGTNLARLAASGRPIGLDRYPDRARFAARAVPAARLVVGDALALPLRDGAVASVLVRDLLHHLPDPRRAVAEAVRVLAPGGVLQLLEPNGRSPIIRLQSWLVPAERGIRDFTPATVGGLLHGLPLDDVRVEMAQGFPLRRVLCHYRFGWPALGRTRAGRAILVALERLGERATPAARWSYVSIRARRR